MAYTGVSFAAAKTALATRLEDPARVRWIEAELGSLIREAIQYWSLCALYFRARVTFPTVANQVFCDLQIATDGSGDNPLERTTTDRELVNALQYSLLEPANDFSSSTVWAGTEQFTMEQLQSALQRRLSQFLFETGVIVQASQQTVTPGNGIVTLSESIIDIVRAAWVELDASGDESNISRLLKMDELTAMRQSPRWSLDKLTKPTAYSAILTQPLQLQLISPPIDVGRLHLLTVNDNADLDITTGVAINLPPDLTQVVVWGARADVLGADGPAQDIPRAQYAERRFKEGCELAKIYVSAMYADINGVPAQICSINDLDCQRFRWQSTTGTPSVLALAGLNLLTMTNVPDGVYSITLDVNRNAILPVDDADFIQISDEFIPLIYDYAQHLASFKEGADELNKTQGQFDRFMQAAAHRNAQLAARAQAFDSLTSKSADQERDAPKRVAA